MNRFDWHVTHTYGAEKTDISGQQKEVILWIKEFRKHSPDPLPLSCDAVGSEISLCVWPVVLVMLNCLDDSVLVHRLLSGLTIVMEHKTGVDDKGKVIALLNAPNRAFSLPKVNSMTILARHNDSPKYCS